LSQKEVCFIHIALSTVFNGHHGGLGISKVSQIDSNKCPFQMEISIALFWLLG